MQVTAQEISLYLNGTLEGNPQAIIQRPARIEEARSGDICFLANPKYHSFAYTTQASVLLVSKDFKPEKPLNPTLIRVDDVYSCVSLLLEKFGEPLPQTSGVDAQAITFAPIFLAISTAAKPTPPEAPRMAIVSPSLSLALSFSACKLVPYA